MSINKVVYNGNTLIDLTEDTVDASNLLVGYTAHDRSGTPIQGAFDPSVYVLKAGDTMTGDLAGTAFLAQNNNNFTQYSPTGLSIHDIYSTIPEVEKRCDYNRQGINITAYTVNDIPGLGRIIQSASLEEGVLSIIKMTPIIPQWGEVAHTEIKGIIIRPQEEDPTDAFYGFSNYHAAVINIGGDLTYTEYTDSVFNHEALRFYDNGEEKTTVSKNELVINDHDLLRLTPHFAQMFATNIQANSDLNTAALLKVGQYYVSSNSTAATLSNCPTSVAFNMKVEAVIQSTYDNESSTYIYRVRTIKDLDGRMWYQNCYVGGTAGSWTYGSWYRILDGRAEEGNSTYWMKAQATRPSSLNFSHMYTDSRVHMRLDCVSSSVSNNPFDGDGFALTFFWDNSGEYNTQVFFPSGNGTPSFREKGNASTWADAWKFQSEKVSTVTTDGVTWTVVRHYDGYVEMYADITLNGTWVAWGSLYVLSMSGNIKSLPVTLTKKLADVTTYITPESGVSANSAFPVQYYMTTENTYACDIARPSAGTNSKNYYCRKYIRGKI